MSMYDFEREVVLQGTLVNFNWTNPHVYIFIEVLDSENNKITRSIEGPAPIALETVGWTSQSLLPGEQVTIIANPSLDQDSNDVLGNAVLIQGGDYLPMGGMRLQEALRR